jgi:thioredoxin-dependent peroxiredoxin
MPDGPQPGDPAPPFELSSTSGIVSLASVLAEGRRLVLAFYHEDGTPSCETQLSMLRDALEMLTEFGARVVAVSADSVESHRAFAERLGGLPFPLASDRALDAARAYGVVDAGDPRRSRRAIFVVDRDGSVLLSIPHYQPANLSQIEAILAVLGAET